MIKIKPVNVQLGKRAISQCINVMSKSRVLPLHTRAQMATFRKAPTGSEPPDLLDSPRAESPPRVPEGGLYFCSGSCVAAAGAA